MSREPQWIDSHEKPKRAGTFRTFERRFAPVPLPDGSIMRDGVPDADVHLIWTMIEGERNRWYLASGVHIVNRLGYVLCERPWSAADEMRDYLY